jgi:hypothetical protein
VARKGVPVVRAAAVPVEVPVEVPVALAAVARQPGRAPAALVPPRSRSQPA